MEGMLIATGEIGYRQASVRAILDYSGGHRVQFYKDFKSKDDCFAQAYEVWIERLGATLLAAALGADGWEAGVRTALIALFEFISDRPAIARAMFVEVQVAGGLAMAEHDEAMERLAAAVDSIRDDIPAAQTPPGPTGMFVVGAIEAAICETLAAGRSDHIWDALPELMHLTVGSYLGKEAGEAAAENARASLSDLRSQGDEGR
jgi:AcrR family transcriptional regulator